MQISWGFETGVRSRERRLINISNELQGGAISSATFQLLPARQVAGCICVGVGCHYDTNYVIHMQK